MSLWRRLALLFRAKTSRALDRIEKPGATLDYSYERQLDLLMEMHRGVATVAAARKRVEIQVKQLERASGKLEDQARQALEHDREELAREALARRAALNGELRDLETQRAQLEAEEQKMVEASRRLEGKVQAFRVRKESMKATYAAAEAQTRVGEAITGISADMGELGRAMKRAEDKIAEMQARGGAVEELTAAGALEDLSGDDRIQSELDRYASDSVVQQDLSRLKAELEAAEPKGLGPSGSKHDN